MPNRMWYDEGIPKKGRMPMLSDYILFFIRGMGTRRFSPDQGKIVFQHSFV